MSDVLDPTPLPEELGIPAEDWQQTPLSVRLVMRTLLKRLEAFEARLNQNSSNSSRPPSTDSPSKKHQRRMKAAERRKPGGTPGHPGHPQVLLEPTQTIPLFPEGCACGHGRFVELPPYHTRKRSQGSQGEHKPRLREQESRSCPHRGGASVIAAHRITSSAWKRRVGGMVRPRACAVLRLMMSSNFIGCCMGRSAGLAPLRILST